MQVNEAITATKSRYSKIFSILLAVLFTLSTMTIPACSGDGSSGEGNNTSYPPRVVQATVYFDDQGPVAVAWVQDMAQDFVSDVFLSINDRPFELTFLGDEADDVVSLGDEAADEYLIPIYYLELYDLIGGDSLTFVAESFDGTLIYAPPPVQIPLPLELVEPRPDQTINPGEEVVVRWAGGEGATHIAAFYAPDQGKEQYYEVREYGDVESMTVPAGTIQEGGGIIGAFALSGDQSYIREYTPEAPLAPSFLVLRSAVGAIPGQVDSAYDNDPTYARKTCPSGQKVGHGCSCCAYNPRSLTKSATLCGLEIVAFGIGAAVWGARFLIDQKKFSPCHFTVNNFASYCGIYGQYYDHYNWTSGCLCPTCSGGDCPKCP